MIRAWNDNETVLDEMAEQLVRDQVIWGASWGFVSDQGIRLKYAGKQGTVVPYCDRNVEAGMYYDLASLTKVIGTTTRILQLVEKGVISLSTPVKEILGLFSYGDVTVEHLLLHSSGLPAEIRNKESWSRENLLEYLYTTQREREAGDGFLYSDVGFILLGKIIENLDETTLEETFREHIFTPLGMKDTTYLVQGSRERCIPTECTELRGCICGEVHDLKAHLLGKCGSAGLFSTLEDIVKFVKAYLDHSRLLFGEEMFEKLCSTIKFERTLGWSKEYGRDTLYHTGFTGTSVLMDLKGRKGFVLLTNRIHPSRNNEEFLKMRKKMNEVYLKMVY
ncbi:serine hydrolase domain-containing protein [Lacrimispora celerecrescens]|uniref:serine hydrolase domain-containing protein n=2 Tax=Clostridia TaxID=186801 RepID=UPI0016496CCA|nr:serine hydrolase domain-containing protein [Lacrimispora celerecrescens]